MSSCDRYRLKFTFLLYSSILIERRDCVCAHKKFQKGRFLIVYYLSSLSIFEQAFLLFHHCFSNTNYLKLSFLIIILRIVSFRIYSNRRAPKSDFIIDLNILNPASMLCIKLANCVQEARCIALIHQ